MGREMDAQTLIMSMFVTNKGNTVWTGALMLLIMNFKPIVQYIKNFVSSRLAKGKGVSMRFDAVLITKNKILNGLEKPKEFTAVHTRLRLAIAKVPSFTDYCIDTKLGDNFIVLTKPFKLNEHIYFTTTMSGTECKEQQFTYVNYSITISTGKVGSYVDIEEFVSNCLEEYALAQKKENDTPKIFIYKECKVQTETIYCTHYDFNTTKSFSNMFFDDKEKVLAKIDYFSQNKKEYERLGIPYTLGMLIHGPPGTAKTSFIKSLAKYTGRHIFVIPIKNVKNIDTLKNIFSFSSVNHTTIPNAKRLYVFEEIDCGEWKDVVTSRELVSSEGSSHISPSPTTLENIVEKMVGKTEVPEEKMTLTLGDFLELLDGIVEISGRMMVMSSNHPEKLDKALVRPGRIDMTLEFKKLTRENVNNLYKLWFGRSIPDSVYARMKDRALTQADIGLLFSSRDLKKIHNALG